MIRRPVSELGAARYDCAVLETLNEWLRLNASQITAAILVFAVQPGLELPPLILRLFSS